MRKVQFLMFFHDFWEYELVVSQIFLIDFRLSIDYFCEFFHGNPAIFFLLILKGYEKYEIVVSQVFFIDFMSFY